MTDNTHAKGVTIALTLGVVIPPWISDANGVTIREDTKHETRHTLLTITGGHALFRGGVVHINLHSSERRHQLAFENVLDVLEIRDTRGNLLQANRRLCHDCFVNTPDARPRLQNNGKYNVDFTCECGRRWYYNDIDWVIHQGSPKVERRAQQRTNR